MSSSNSFVALCAVAAVFVLAASSANAEKLKLCAQEQVTATVCNSLDSEESPVNCRRVVDSSNCAIDLAEGRADFGVFTADELVLAHHFYPTDFQVVARLRNREKPYNQFEFETVAVVESSYKASGNGGFGDLIGAGFCHPGFSKSQDWNDNVLKYFEQKIMDNVCRKDVTLAENELINLKEFFKKACRPGQWVADPQWDKELKNKYPELCALCDTNCSYNRSSDVHGHFGAVECLISRRGRVAYISHQRLKDYKAIFNKAMSDYRLLCDDGTVMALDSPNPCTWYKQPWPVVLSRGDKAGQVLRVLKDVERPQYASSTWQDNLSKALLLQANEASIYENETSVEHYLRSGGRQLTSSAGQCGQQIGWCSVGREEAAKCNWTSAAALSLGIRPSIACLEARDTFDCFHRMANASGAGDAPTIASIDSSYGYLARKAYGLTGALFAKSMESNYSMVVAAMRESRAASSWAAAVRGRGACFPEYGGIAWLSFVRVAREQRLLARNSCRYPEILAELLGAACSPGLSQASHFQARLKLRLDASTLQKLCSLCPRQLNNEHCEASPENRYFGDKGALDCLKSGHGDIAFLEPRNLRAHINNGSINESDFRVLCKNGSLAMNAGLQVDERCALSVTIDGEVVSRRDLPSRPLLDMTNVLLKIDDWLGLRERKMLFVYGPFNGTDNLLFRGSTLQLELAAGSKSEAVTAYKDLFSHVDACSSAASSYITFLTLAVSFSLSVLIMI